jgi:hypothetical protein
MIGCQSVVNVTLRPIGFASGAWLVDMIVVMLMSYYLLLCELIS